MLQYLKNESNKTFTENGAVTYSSTFNNCLDFFAMVGGMRFESDERITALFTRAYSEDPETAMKLLFYARDIRGGIGERRIFRCILSKLASEHKSSVVKNIENIAEFGRYDDLLTLLSTPCEKEMAKYISGQLKADIEAMNAGKPVSLLAKWLPSVNASNKETVEKGHRMASLLGMKVSDYRKTLSALRACEKILENSLRERDYTFDYSKQPSKAMLKYRRAFIRNDEERYSRFLAEVESGEKQLHTSTLAPYEIIAPILHDRLTEEETRPLDVTWNSQEDFTNGENALVVVDGSGSMYWSCYSTVKPIDVALSLGIYFAERNEGVFKNHFITFSENPQLVEIKGETIADKVRYCESYNEIANTNIQRVFELILKTAVKNGLPQSELPTTLYIVSDMEFDYCADGADITNFEHAKSLFEQHGYKLPQVVFWNVASRHSNVPVKQNEQGAVLVSGVSPRIFSMVKSQCYDPLKFMMEVVNSERYSCITP